jgi:hypothetical protein
MFVVADDEGIGSLELRAVPGIFSGFFQMNEVLADGDTGALAESFEIWRVFAKEIPVRINHVEGGLHPGWNKWCQEQDQDKR